MKKLMSSESIANIAFDMSSLIDLKKPQIINMKQSDQDIEATVLKDVESVRDAFFKLAEVWPHNNILVDLLLKKETLKSERPELDHKIDLKGDTFHYTIRIEVEDVPCELHIEGKIESKRQWHKPYMVYKSLSVRFDQVLETEDELAKKNREQVAGKFLSFADDVHQAREEDETLPEYHTDPLPVMNHNDKKGNTGGISLRKWGVVMLFSGGIVSMSGVALSGYVAFALNTMPWFGLATLGLGGGLLVFGKFFMSLESPYNSVNIPHVGSGQTKAVSSKQIKTGKKVRMKAESVKQEKRSASSSMITQPDNGLHTSEKKDTPRHTGMGC